MAERSRNRPRSEGRPGPGRGPRRGRLLTRRPVLIGAGIALVVVVGLGAAVALGGGDDGRAPAAVSVAGTDVSGKNAQQIAAVTRTRARALLREPIVITRDDDASFRIAITRRALGASPRIAATVNEALEPRGLGGRALSAVGLAPTRDVPITFTLSEARVNALVKQVTGRVNDDPTAASVEVTDQEITVVPGASGFGVDPDALRAQIRRLPERIELDPGPLPPPVSAAAAERARRLAARIVAHPVSVTLEGRGVPIEPDVLRAALRFTRTGDALAVSLDNRTLYDRISSAYSTREQPVRNASLKVVGNGVRVVSSRSGRSLDMDAIGAAIVADPDATSVRARFKVTEPTTTTAQIKALKITGLVSEFSTPYNCCEPRVTNIQRAAEIINGTIIPAGHTFSLNDTLGPRTPERGFVEAPQIAAGRLEDAVGGGVSQVATTLYNAAFFAGLQLDSHTPHQFWISRYPKGREATVSLGGPELIFTNDWDAGILINAYAGANGITVRFFSSPLGRRVETETGEDRDVVEATTKTTTDPDLEPGATVVEQSAGGPGFTVSYTRKVYQGDKLRSDQTFTWTYSPENGYVQVGPEAPSTTAPEGATTAPRDGTTAPRTTTAPSGGTPPAPGARGGATTTSSSGAAAPPP